MPLTKITRCLPSVWKETRSLTKTVPGGGAGAGNSTGCCESGFMGVSMPDRSVRGKTKNPEVRTYGKTQKADRFWFAPGTAKKVGQWWLQTRCCRNHAGLFVNRPQVTELRTFNGRRKKRTGF